MLPTGTVASSELGPDIVLVREHLVVPVMGREAARIVFVQDLHLYGAKGEEYRAPSQPSSSACL